MSNFTKFGAALATVTLCMALNVDDASARRAYLSGVPNTDMVGSCGTCHVAPGGSGPRNAFGLDVQANLDGGPDWGAVYDIDSDGDGFTNGEELCDADGSWAMDGMLDADCTPTKPGDSASKPESQPANNMAANNDPANNMAANNVNADPGNADPGNADPGNADPGNADPGNADPGNADPGNADPGNSDAGNSDTGNSDAGNSDAGNADAGNADAGNADAGNSSANNSSGNNSSGDANNSSGGDDMSGGDDDDEPACASTGTDKPAGSGLTLLGLVGMVAFWRRRKNA